MTEKIPRKLLTDEEKKVNAIAARHTFIAKQKAKGYKVLQLWVPDALIEGVKEIAKEMIQEYEGAPGKR